VLCSWAKKIQLSTMRCGWLKVYVLVSGSSCPRLSPGLDHCVVFLGKALYSNSPSLHPGVKMATSKFNAGSNSAID